MDDADVAVLTGMGFTPEQAVQVGPTVQHLLCARHAQRHLACCSAGFIGTAHSSCLVWTRGACSVHVALQDASISGLSTVTSKPPGFQ